MSCKSGIFVSNQASQSAASGSTLDLGTVIRRFGSNVALSGNGIMISGSGYYDVDATVIAAPTATGTVTVSLYKDGVAVPGATASMTVGTAGDIVTLPIVAMIREQCCNSSSTLTLNLSGVASTVTNVAMRVKKL